MGITTTSYNHLESSPLDEALPLRPPAMVMDLKRLGSMHQTRLSFMRHLMRRIMREQWQIRATVTELDEHGYGTVVYTVNTGRNIYSYVLFSDFLADAERNDRVIAEKWDVTMTLCIGEVSADQIRELRRQVPKQEGGRLNSKMLVLSRGNKSSRNFDYVVNELAAGRQPSMQQLAEVGYLYRTTAVYGSGKFGMADWAKVKSECADFAQPFAAEMFNCYLLRHFSIEQAEHLARIQSPETAVRMDDEVKRFIGIGNSTGLGMAPFLIRHPRLISRWVLVREKALARVVHRGAIDRLRLLALDAILDKIIHHLQQTSVPDAIQIARNASMQEELVALRSWLTGYDQRQQNWVGLLEYLERNASMETQEMINSLLMELYPELIDDFEQYPCVDEQYQLQPQMPLSELKVLIEQRYDWALQIDFCKPQANHFFWYRSVEKMEPRLGQRDVEPGQDKEMPMLIARRVKECHQHLCDDIKLNSADQTVARFVARNPSLGAIVKRIQSMSQECYGEIRANLADKEMRPLDLLRCKLSFFGVSKFDPKSSLWVRNTMFQGAPIVADIGSPFADDWYFPTVLSAQRQKKTGH